MNYSDNVHHLQLENKNILLIGTAHISQESTDEVIQIIETEKPETVCVELCPSRYESLSQKDRWKNMDIFRVIREKKTFLLLANIILSSFQKKLGDKLGIQPGKEMVAAINSAKSIQAEIVLADRDVQTTFQKTWRSLPFREKMSVLTQLVMSVFISEEISKEDIEKMKTHDVLTETMEAFSSQSPMMKKVLIDERDQYLAEKIRTAPGQKIVAVVGAGHVPGIKKQIHQEQDLAQLERVPPPGQWGNVIKWGIPAVIVALIVYGFVAADWNVGLEMIKRWFLINGILSALGVVLAAGHPLTILSAFVAAPFTSLNPTIAAGWVAGLVEAIVRKPQVRDFENLAHDITQVSGFWKNKVTRILLIVVFANVGSMIGTFIGGGAIIDLL
ncbi:MAG: TraB/GumN family protein [SAR324 cluster bacterium]|nr:TraB/GumN family protein [SAR324 cluster bacterium]